jgi:hypothetical protein
VIETFAGELLAQADDQIDCGLCQWVGVRAAGTGLERVSLRTWQLLQEHKASGQSDATYSKPKIQTAYFPTRLSNPYP